MIETFYSMNKFYKSISINIENDNNSYWNVKYVLVLYSMDLLKNKIITLTSQLCTLLWDLYRNKFVEIIRVKQKVFEAFSPMLIISNDELYTIRSVALGGSLVDEFNRGFSVSLCNTL